VSTKSEDDKQVNWTAVPLKYAKGFTIEKYENRIRLSIINPADSTNFLKQVILVKNGDAQKLRSNEIAVPNKRIICSSSTQLAYFMELGAYEHIVGINSSRFLHNKTMQERIQAKQVARIGKEGNFNAELIVSLEPEVIMVSPFKAGGYDAMKNLEIALVPMAAHKEATPLAKAEWIKMVALFLGKEDQADSIFQCIDAEYMRLKKLAQAVEEKPTIFSGKLIGDKWYVPGGNSFYAHYFADAGAQYVFNNDKTGAEPMDFEVVFEKAQNTDYWRVLTSSPLDFNKQMFKQEDDRYADFSAFQNNNILVCNIREVPFYEQNPVKPHLILSDYVYQFHPSLMPAEYKPFFWKKLR